MPRPFVRSLFPAVFSLVALLSVRTPAFAQGTTVSGVVADAQGAALARAVVRLLDGHQREVRSTLTDDTGRFKIDASGCSGCKVEASLGGFTPASASAGSPELRLTLALAPVRESVVVTATRDEVPASQVGATTTVVRGDDLERRGVALVSEALRQVPGVAVIRTGGFGGVTSVFVRGGESDYNKVLLDGVPLNEPGGTFNFSNLTTANLDRIEIVRGAQSALFGSDAMSSVIQLLTKRGVGSGTRPHGAATIEAGGYDSVRGGAELRGQQGRVDYAIYGGGFGTDNRVPNNRFTNSTLSWNGGAELAPGVSVRTVGRTEWSRAGTPGQTALGRPDLDAHFDRHDTVAGVTLQHEHATYKGRFTYARSTSNQESVNLIADPDYTPQLGNNIGPFAFSDFTYDLQNILTRHRVSYQGDLRLGSLGAFAATQIVTGTVDYDGERATLSDRMFNVTETPSRNNTGVALQYQAVSTRLSLTGGVRVEDNASFGTAALPRVSASVLVHPGHTAFGETRVKFNAGLGVKEPTLLESFSPSPFGLGNPDLKPERTRAVDFGVEQRLAGDRAKIEAVFFSNRYRNIIATRTISFTPFTSQYFNIGLTTAQGLELSSEVAPTPEIRINGGYTFTDSEIIESTSTSPVLAVGQPAFRRPRHSGFLQLGWARRAVSVDLTGTFVGRRTDSDFFALATPVTSIDGYALWSLGGSYRVTPNVSAYVRVDNLTDKDYMEPFGYQPWRRTASAGVRVGF
jgi:outer membrane cobalamin receptor